MRGGVRRVQLCSDSLPRPTLPSLSKGGGAEAVIDQRGSSASERAGRRPCRPNPRTRCLSNRHSISDASSATFVTLPGVRARTGNRRPFWRLTASLCVAPPETVQTICATPSPHPPRGIAQWPESPRCAVQQPRSDLPQRACVWTRGRAVWLPPNPRTAGPSLPCSAAHTAWDQRITAQS